jgi:hypothetical protein
MPQVRLRQRLRHAEVAVKCPTCGLSVVRIRQRLTEMAELLGHDLPEKQAKQILKRFQAIWNS